MWIVFRFQQNGNQPILKRGRIYHGQKSNFRWYISTGAAINSLFFFLMIFSTRVAGWTWDDHNYYPGNLFIISPLMKKVEKVSKRKL